jgi:hypothetical protein
METPASLHSIRLSGAFMAKKEFLNPLLRIILCLLGMVVTGYYSYQSFLAGQVYTWEFALRFLVFLGFSFLLVASIEKLIGTK